MCVIGFEEKNNFPEVDFFYKSPVLHDIYVTFSDKKSRGFLLANFKTRVLSSKFISPLFFVISMQCYMCKKYFCFVCLLPTRDDGSWQCNGYSDRCPNGVHPVQTVGISSLATRVRLDFAAQAESEKITRSQWTIGSTVEYFDRAGDVHAWKVGTVIGMERLWVFSRFLILLNSP